MKKTLFFTCLLFAGVSLGKENPNFQPVYLSSDNVTQARKLVQPILLNFNYPPSNKQNCITDISVSNLNFPTHYQVYILDGQSGTTAYTMVTTTDTIQETFYKENPLCLSFGVTTYVYVSSGNYKVNIFGYEKGR